MSLQNTEKQNIKVMLRTTIDNGSETDTFELTAFGTKFSKGNALYLQYTEESENGKTQTTIKYKESETLLMRSGAVKMRQVFSLAEITNGHYESMYGTMAMQTRTKLVSHIWNVEKREGKFLFDYDLFMQGDLLGQYEMVIAYKEEA
ncbi:DUF1934 domain-containing protein [Peribacillus cavernae]|uniref:DUF1934 domain-containing protein n=1 Tax=Peribacillus cavernae TaxID=1674310 RepID=A0A3S0U5M9_9BACI|nr:DUF1934 domain-containing protein [Peribacillus cavernae]MDQ0218546.1 uncharacterized beta-barrel protein YwiB (DUF1934 family) [Peribacillus cavernae]RUQ31536.1 DUF1934 domain-containing protein [Peribacillus cavernae]